MIDNLIRDTALRFLNILGEQSQTLKEFFTEQDNIELIDEAIEILTDESLRNFDEYVDSLEQDEPEQ